MNAKKAPHPGTPAQVERLLECLAKGHYLSVACKASGICRTSVWDYAKRNPEFGARVRAAIAAAEQACLSAIIEAPEWQARAWILERRFPQRWARRQPDVVVQNTVTGPTLPSDPAERAAVLRALADREDARARGKR